MGRFIQSLYMSQKVFSDSTVFELTKAFYNEFKADEKEQRLDVEEIPDFKNKFIKPLYPRQILIENGTQIFQKYSCSSICCKLNPGYFFCCNTGVPDPAYRSLGLGMCLYFKFIKHLFVSFIILSLISTVSILLYHLVAYHDKIGNINGYKQFIFSSSIGTMSAPLLKCTYSQANNSSTINIITKCPTGTVNLLSPVFSSLSLSNIQNCNSQITKVKNGDTTYTIDNYVKSTSCNADNNQCVVSLNISSSLKFERVAMTYECRQTKYQLGSLVLPNSTIIYISVGIDLLISICIVLLVASEDQAQKKQCQYFRQSEMSLKDFSIEIKGFNSQYVEQQFNYFIKQLEKSLNNFSDKIVMVKVPDDPTFLAFQEERRAKYQAIYQLIKKYYFSYKLDPNNYQNEQSFKEKYFYELQTYLNYKSQLTELIYDFINSKTKEKSIKPRLLSLFLVMETPKDKKRLYHFSTKQCFSQILHINGKRYELGEPPVPDLIKWGNLTKLTWVRVIISWIITLVLCFCSYLIIGLIEWQKNKIIVGYSFNIDCNVIFPNTSFTTWSDSLYSQNYLHCYCYNNIYNIGSSQFSSRCSEWSKKYITYLITPIFISLAVVGYNMIVSVLFRFLSRFEGHSLLTNKLYSYTMKRAFLLILNMGLVIIIVTIDYGKNTINLKQSSFLFQGIYKDITSDWYFNIGLVLIITLTINVVFPIIQLILKQMWMWVRKLWDKRCYCRVTSKKTKKQYLQLYSGNIFPIEERYAEIIAIFVITLAFNGVMPLMNIVATLSFLFMFVCDKFLIFRVYKKPINYDNKLQRKVLKTIFGAIIIHMLSTPFLLSQPNLLVSGSKLEQASILTTSNQRINSIVTTNYIIPYVILFVLLMVFGILKTTIIRLFQNCLAKLSPNQSIIKNKQKLSQSFFDSLQNYHITQLIHVCESQKTNALQQNRQKQSIRPEYMSRKMIEKIDTTSIQLVVSEENTRNKIINRTLNRVKTLPQRSSLENRARLIGMPAYDIMFTNDYLKLAQKVIIVDQIIDRIIRQNNK